MTPDAARKFWKALALVTVCVGGFGSALCVPYALTTSLSLITMAGVYLIACALLIAGGLVAYSILIDQEKSIVQVQEQQ